LSFCSACAAGPRAVAGTPGAFAFGLRLVAWDGTGLDAADTPANAAAFGVTQGGNPQLRLVALTECGTHAIIDASFDGVERASEDRLARRLLPALRPGMLLLADRNFPGYELWGLAAGTGADLAWRIKKNLIFPPAEVLPDGPFLPVMATPAENIRLGQARAAGRIPAGRPEGHLERIIECTITIRAGDGTTRIEPFRLVTTLLDHRQAPAAELAALFHERWEIEDGYGEMKTRLRGAAFILRSRSPELVRQEVLAFLTVYQALCALKAEAARHAGLDPDRISFTVTVRIARQNASSPVASTPVNLALARHQAIRDLIGDPLPRRRDQQCERAKKPAEEHLPVQETRPRTAAQPSHLPDQIKRMVPSPAQTP